MNHSGRVFFYEDRGLGRAAFLLIVGEVNNDVLTIEFFHVEGQWFMKQYRKQHIVPWFNDHPGWIEVGA